MKIVISSSNEGKVREIKEILGDKYEVLSKKELGFGQVDVEETGTTLRENAYLKAKFLFDKTGENSLADDTGLFIDALNGEPGIYAARYAGEHCNFEDNMNKVLRNMKGIPFENRTATFKTSLCLIRQDGSVEYYDGECKGRILEKMRGNKGFGYDPIFLPEGYDISMGEMDEDLKNKISHRRNAFRKLCENL